jgi:aspartyl-tRNA synthetase
VFIVLDFLGELQRTHTCGELRASHAGETVTLMGWVNRRRDLGSLIFIDIRDRSGITQVVFDTDNPAVHQKAEDLRNEYVIAVTGSVKKRDEKTFNEKIATGEVEVVATELKVLNDSKTLPFTPADTVLPNEEMRLQYRYIDLRRPEMQKNIILRHGISLAIRGYLASQAFIEIETPFMTRSTPEGARDYLVPSRVHHGSFYALPQSPQLFKQILMISGFDRYFQIVRCFRDEDLRADRQPEFTQIDLEMSFPQQETIFDTVEGFLTAAFKVAGHSLQTPFPQMSYDQAMRMYGSDKPDLRLPAMTDVRELFTPEACNTLKINPDMPVMLIRIPKVGELSRKERDEIKTLFKNNGAKLFEDWKRIEKSFPQITARIKERAEPQEGDLLVLVAGPQQPTADHPIEAGESAQPKPIVKLHDVNIYTSAGLLRVALGQKYADRHGCFKPGDFRFLWVTDFPMFEWDEQDQRWAAAHHPFTSPHESDMEKLSSGLAAAKDPNSALREVRALAYDVVLNGTELGSGSIRIHRQDIQSKIFEALGMDEDEQQRRFGFFLEALKYGTPPHGGIALGLDRIVMIIAGADSLREVIPFPKTAAAKDLMCDAPTPVADSQLNELGIAVKADH